MSYKFSKKSKEKLETCHPDLQKVMTEVLNYVDITILEGIRTKKRQEELVRTGKSKTMNSMHLEQDDGYSYAVDVGRFIHGRVEWNDVRYYYYMAGIILTIADQLGVNIRWGGDWDSDTDFNDQTFDDLVHFELEK